jgi:hypothetical protein
MVQMRTGQFGWGGEGKPDRFQVFATQDKEICKRVEEVFRYSWRDAPKYQGVGASGCEPYGELQITTDKGQVFVIGLYSQFVVGELYENSWSGFTSYPLAIVAAELYQKASGKKLGEERFKKLSGDFWLEWGHKQYGEYDLPEPEGPSHGCN